MPGVHAAVTGSTKGAKPDLALRVGQGRGKALRSHCRYEGDAVAGICAETPYQAWDAARAIKVDYEVLPFVSDERKALDPKAHAVEAPDKRVAKTEKYERGDLDKGFAEADAVLETEYRTNAKSTRRLNRTERREMGRRSLDLVAFDQGVSTFSKQVAEVLWDASLQGQGHRSVYGSGFGSKLEAGKYTIIAALLAKMTGSP